MSEHKFPVKINTGKSIHEKLNVGLRCTNQVRCGNVSYTGDSRFETLLCEDKFSSDAK